MPSPTRFAVAKQALKQEFKWAFKRMRVTCRSRSTNTFQELNFFALNWRCFFKGEIFSGFYRKPTVAAAAPMYQEQVCLTSWWGQVCLEFVLAGNHQAFSSQEWLTSFIFWEGLRHHGQFSWHMAYRLFKKLCYSWMFVFRGVGEHLPNWMMVKSPRTGSWGQSL